MMQQIPLSDEEAPPQHRGSSSTTNQEGSFEIPGWKVKKDGQFEVDSWRLKIRNR
jgi:hypothetical protein